MAPVQLIAHQRPEQLADLTTAARERHRDPANMPPDVEVLVLDPHRAVQVQRHLLELPAELGNQGQTFVRALPDGFEGEPVGSRRVDYGQPAHVLVPRRSLRRKEQRIGSGEPHHPRAKRSLHLLPSFVTLGSSGACRAQVSTSSRPVSCGQTAGAWRRWVLEEAPGHSGVGRPQREAGPRFAWMRRQPVLHTLHGVRTASRIGGVAASRDVGI
jgi:hypothetical protein